MASLQRLKNQSHEHLSELLEQIKNKDSSATNIFIPCFSFLFISFSLPSHEPVKCSIGRELVRLYLFLRCLYGCSVLLKILQWYRKRFEVLLDTVVEEMGLIEIKLYH